MKYHVEIECDNAAFEDDRDAEIARILRDLAKHVERGDGDERRLHDSNGNWVGYGAFYKSRRPRRVERALERIAILEDAIGIGRKA